MVSVARPGEGAPDGVVDVVDVVDEVDVVVDERVRRAVRLVPFQVRQQGRDMRFGYRHCVVFSLCCQVRGPHLLTISAPSRVVAIAVRADGFAAQGPCTAEVCNWISDIWDGLPREIRSSGHP